MEFLLLTCLIGLFAIMAAYLAPFAGAGKRNSWLLAFIISGLLTPVTLFLLNQQNLVLEQQNEVIQWAAGKWQPQRTIEKKQAWVNTNFVFIDISFARKLVDKPSGNQLGNSNMAITDRNSIARLLQQLNGSDTLVDLVICDMYFDSPTADDSLLQDAMTATNLYPKLVTGFNALGPNIPFFASLPDSMHGNIVELANDNRFATHTIFNHGRPGLAYLAYKKIAGIETNTLLGTLLTSESRSGSVSGYGLNSFIPQFEFTEEKRLYVDQAYFAGKEQSEAVDMYNYIELGDIVSNPAGGMLFQELLSQRKARGCRNIIFIGAFKSEDMDVHDTFYGKLHGPTIHLNLLYAFMQGQHRLNLVYVFYLWVMMTFIVYLAIRRSLDLPMFISTARAHTGKPKRNRFRAALHSAWYLLIVDELHFWVFAAFVFVTALAWGRMINGLVLFFILLLFYKVFRYYKEHKHD